MGRLITAICSALPATGIPLEVCYVPEGKQKIYPQSHPNGVWVDMPAEQGVAIAARFDGQLQDLLKANVKPWIDFEHTGRYPSAGRPTAFRYEPGKGLMCAMDWSTSGRRAIKGKDVNYFSPRVDIDEKGIPTSLPKRGPLGGLVTEPAFRDGTAIAANHAEDTPNHPAMIPILASCGLLTANEAALEGAETLAASRVTALKANAEKIVTLEAGLKTAEKERDEWKKKFEDAEEAGKADKEKRAKEKVEAAVAAGKIAPKDEDTRKYFTARIVAGDSFAEKMLESLPKLHPGIETPIVNGGADKPVVAGEHAFVAEARKLITANQAKDEEEAFSLVASSKPDLYEDYCKQFAA
jgi:hypothetical protein